MHKFCKCFNVIFLKFPSYMCSLEELRPDRFGILGADADTDTRQQEMRSTDNTNSRASAAHSQAQMQGLILRRKDAITNFCGL